MSESWVGSKSVPVEARFVKLFPLFRLDTVPSESHSS